MVVYSFYVLNCSLTLQFKLCQYQVKAKNKKNIIFYYDQVSQRWKTENYIAIMRMVNIL